MAVQVANNVTTVAQGKERNKKKKSSKKCKNSLLQQCF